MSKTIIVPTDFSANALTATLYAFELAEKMAAEITLLHAYTAFRSPFQSDLANKTDEQRARIGAEKGMRAFLEILAKHTGSDRINSVLEKAQLEDAVTRHVAESNADLVIMGTHGASGIKKGLLGSNTYNVVKQVQVPLLIVPEKGTNDHLDHALFFTDYQEADSATLAAMVSLFAGIVKRCTLVHIHEGLASPTDADRSRLETWQKRLEAVAGGMQLDTELVHHREDLEVVEQTIDRLDGSFVALTLVGGRSFYEKLSHKSLAKEIVHQPTMPVLLLRDFK